MAVRGLKNEQMKEIEIEFSVPPLSLYLSIKAMWALGFSLYRRRRRRGVCLLP